MKGQGYTNLTFSRNGKAFGSIKMFKAALKGMIRCNTEDYDGVYIPEKVQRTRVTSWAQHLVYSDENVKMVMNKVK